jgi:hypothetical protein
LSSSPRPQLSQSISFPVWFMRSTDCQTLVFIPFGFDKRRARPQFGLN